MIPKVIYQSWKTKKLPPDMKKNVDSLREMNPEYEYVLYDDEDCRKFLLEEYGENYLNAFDVLIPGAFKCDFWRYAMLYKYGGVYIDIDMVPMVPLREMIREDNTFVSIVDKTWEDWRRMKDWPGIYQAFFACIPGHPIVKSSLDISFSNIVTRKDASIVPLSLTGPAVMLVAFNLFLGRRDTYQEVKTGDYPDGVSLPFINLGDIVVDKTNRTVFKDKFDGYWEKTDNYGKISHFKDSNYSLYTWDNRRRSIFTSLLFLSILCLCIYFSVSYYKKLKVCEKVCSPDK